MRTASGEPASSWPPRGSETGPSGIGPESRTGPSGLGPGSRTGPWDTGRPLAAGPPGRPGTGPRATGPLGGPGTGPSGIRPSAPPAPGLPGIGPSSVRVPCAVPVDFLLGLGLNQPPPPLLPSIGLPRLERLSVALRGLDPTPPARIHERDLRRRKPPLCPGCPDSHRRETRALPEVTHGFNGWHRPSAPPLSGIRRRKTERQSRAPHILHRFSSIGGVDRRPAPADAAAPWAFSRPRGSRRRARAAWDRCSRGTGRRTGAASG